MDPFAAVGITVIGGVLGYVVAAQKYAKQARVFQQQMLGSNMESLTRFANAALATITEDYGHTRDEAVDKLFKRCAAQGMQLVQVDTKTGEMKAI